MDGTCSAGFVGEESVDGAELVRESYFVTTSISSKGQVVIPREIRDRRRLEPGDDLLVLELSNGDILLRPVRKPKRSLVWHLRQLRGLEVPRQQQAMREVDW
jgi:AbrB family looped-hinge helix DNA binding protein